MRPVYFWVSSLAPLPLPFLPLPLPFLPLPEPLGFPGIFAISLLLSLPELLPLPLPFAFVLVSLF